MFALLASLSSAQADDLPPLKWDFGGSYSLWNLQQNNFLLGAEHPLDDAAYTVQVLRVRGAVSREHFGVVARADLAQGWWGVDNNPADGYALSTAEDGTTTTTRVYNDDGLFENKETNYAIHVDMAYGWAEFGPVELRGGRQNVQYGNKLVLDEDVDGVTVILRPAKPIAVEAFWAKISEGKYSYTLPTSALLGDLEDNSDADLFGGRARYTSDAVNGELFGLYYTDTIASDWAYYPNGLGYSQARFRPQVTQLTALGLVGDGKFPFGLSWKAEGDVLFGKDDIDNADFALGVLDKNNGELFGWNAYVDATQKVPVGKMVLDVGAAFGMGSGAENPEGGTGNVNKLSTQGFFFFTNVWEDSIMPDVEGITPQGLGSPASRGYREFENTTAVQGRLGFTPIEALRVEASFSSMHATEPVHGYDATGAPSGTTSSDLGWEVDANAIVKVRKGGVQFAERFGYFKPGEAASLLMTGANDHLDGAWEARTEAQINF